MQTARKSANRYNDVQKGRERAREGESCGWGVTECVTECVIECVTECVTEFVTDM